MISVTLSELRRLFDLPPLAAEPEFRLGPICVDSRRLEPGQTFVAIRGANADGHDFIEQAIQRGAGLIVHSAPLSRRSLGRCRFLQVPDTTRALQDLASYVRRKWGRTVVAITGSMGKTTCRHFSAGLLRERYHVLESPRNFNNHFGVPLSLLGLEESHQVAVIELAMNHAGEIGRLAAISRPDVGLITNVAPVHLEFFSGLSGIAEAKGELIAALPSEGTFVFNRDDRHVLGLAQRFPGRKLSFSLSDPADVEVVDYAFNHLQSMEFQLNVWNRYLRCRVPFAGLHFLQNLAAATAVALSLGLSHRQILDGIGRLQPVRQRGAVKRIAMGDGEITVYDDSYNSNPEAVRRLLETVTRLTGFGRRVLVLGEMLELGKSSPELHRQVGREAARSGADLLFGVGDQARFFLEGARQEKMPSARLEHCGNSLQAARLLLRRLQPRDFVVVKGSRGNHMETIVEHLQGPRSEVAP